MAFDFDFLWYELIHLFIGFFSININLFFFYCTCWVVSLLFCLIAIIIRRFESETKTKTKTKTSSTFFSNMTEWWDRYDHYPSSIDNIYEREFGEALNPLNQLYQDDDDDNDPLQFIR